MISEIEEGISR